MNTSLRYTALALLLAFAGTQVNAMHNNFALTSFQEGSYTINLNEPISDQEAKSLIQSIKENATAQATLQKLKDGYHSASSVLADVIAHPALKKCGIAVAGFGTAAVVCKLAYKTETGKVVYKKLCDSATYAKNAIINHPKTSSAAGIAALTGIALFVAQQKGYINPVTATIGTFLANNELIQSMYAKLPSLSGIKEYFTFRNAVGLGAMGATAATVKKMFSAQKALPAAPSTVKPALPAPVKQVAQPAPKQVQAPVKQVAPKQAQAPVQKKSWLPSLPSFGNSKKQLEAAAKEAAQKQAQELVKQQAEQRAAQQLADLRKAQNIALNDFLKSARKEVFSGVRGQATTKTSLNQLDKQANQELVAAYNNFVSSQTIVTKQALNKQLMKYNA